MTDPLSTIRQTLLSGCGPIKNALAACDALEAERLTPEEAIDLLYAVEAAEHGHVFHVDAELVAKLEKWAGD